eukprot:TRINITY_DN50252_c0_g1_i1.p1 TRINITY_DN50252_c0_g1~~TRINITY_DN50252_c0_g1_i1.p1  ORF type:complete len:341 (+),score=68.05 TRINITY_DN50252_c0_g1_i1:54-1025(+)
MPGDTLKVGLCQMAPVWLNREATLKKVIAYVTDAADQGCDLVAFGEALVPGYPFFSAITGGARWNAKDQKELHAHYMANAVNIERGDLDEVTAVAKRRGIAIYLGTIERASDRGGHSLYCTMVYIDKAGRIGSVHRKLCPTYDERLNWAPGDGHGLRTHSLPPFTVGGLNCWENWMPLTRAAMYAQGEDLHVAIWPGSIRNTAGITRFLAVEGRSYVMSVSGMMRAEDFPEGTPHLETLKTAAGSSFLADGGSCLAGPDGEFIIEPQVGKEGLFTAVINHARVREERQNFDPAGHYSRPDVTQLVVNRTRQSTLRIVESGAKL